MPITFLVIGIVLLISAVNNQATQLFALVKGDFSSTSAAPGVSGTSTSFLPWVVSIFAIGALGYIPALKTLSRAFLVLVIVVLFLSKNGFFNKLETAFPSLFPATSSSNVGASTGTVASSISRIGSLSGLPS